VRSAWARTGVGILQGEVDPAAVHARDTLPHGEGDGGGESRVGELAAAQRGAHDEAVRQQVEARAADRVVPRTAHAHRQGGRHEPTGQKRRRLPLLLLLGLARVSGHLCRFVALHRLWVYGARELDRLGKVVHTAADTTGVVRTADGIRPAVVQYHSPPRGDATEEHLVHEVLLALRGLRAERGQGPVAHPGILLAEPLVLLSLFRMKVDDDLCEWLLVVVIISLCFRMSFSCQPEGLSPGCRVLWCLLSHVLRGLLGPAVPHPEVVLADKWQAIQAALRGGDDALIAWVSDRVLEHALERGSRQALHCAS